MKKQLFFFLIFGLLSAVFGAKKTLSISQVTTLPLIDGIVLPQEWEVTDSANGFIQMEPDKGAPASEKTVVYCMYSKRTLYVAFKCFARQPEQIVADIQTRDVLVKSDDAVAVLLDTYFDRRSAFGFFINPLGTLTDIRIGDDGRNLDINWDTQWKAVAVRTEWGWSAEFAIPFASLSYDAALTQWGVNFGRIIRSNAETAYWSGVMNNDFRISQGGVLDGLKLPVRKHTFNITPYSTFRFETTDRERKLVGDAGADVSYRISSNLLTNVTVNPDFATVEGDQERINFTRWELDFPEKRLFFLEGNELYKTRIRTFYSRRIGEIDFGGKMTGKIGEYTLSILGTHSPANSETENPAANFGVVRVKRDVFKSSTVGLTYVDKNWEDGYTRSLSTDFVLNPGKSWKITGQFVGSAPVASDFLKSSAWFFRVAKESNLYHFHVRYSDTGEKFRDNVNQTGYIKDDDMQEIDSDFNYTWWFQQSLFKYLRFSSKNNIFWNHQQVLRSWYVTDLIRIYLTNRFSLEFFYNDEFKLYEKKFYNHQYNFQLGYNTDEWAAVALDYRWGHNYDRDFTLWNANFRFSPIENLSLAYEFKKLDYTPDPTTRSTLINILTTDYNFTRDLWIRILAQNNSRQDRVYFYGLFAWRFQPPFGALYLIYTAEEMPGYLSNDEASNRIFFVKVAYQLFTK